MAAQLARLPDAELEVMQALWSLGSIPPTRRTSPPA